MNLSAINKLHNTNAIVIMPITIISRILDSSLSGGGHILHLLYFINSVGVVNNALAICSKSCNRGSLSPVSHIAIVDCLTLSIIASSCRVRPAFLRASLRLLAKFISALSLLPYHKALAGLIDRYLAPVIFCTFRANIFHNLRELLPILPFVFLAPGLWANSHPDL